MKDAKYFEENVNMIVEVEYESGGKSRQAMKGVEVKPYLDKVVDNKETYFSDCDYSTKQDDEWVRKVLNTADYNWRHNRKWWMDDLKFTSLGQLVDYIIDHKLVA